MRLELVTVGTELLLGFTHDTNAADIAQALAAVGGIIDRRATVGDDHAQIHDAVSQALERTRFVVVTGGLGPTRDDVTKRAVAELFGAPLELDEAYLETLRERFARFGRGPMPPSNRSQAEVPRGATVLPNPRGTAPGLWLEGTPGVAVLLPGVPHEMRGLLAEQVVPRVRARIAEDGGAARVTLSRALRTSGIGESALADLLTEVEPRLPPITLAYLPQLAGVDLRLTAWRLPPATSTARGTPRSPPSFSTCCARGATSSRWRSRVRVDSSAPPSPRCPVRRQRFSGASCRTRTSRRSATSVSTPRSSSATARSVRRSPWRWPTGPPSGSASQRPPP
jgi:nicotinamide-nucleotide amidase